MTLNHIIKKDYLAFAIIGLLAFFVDAFFLYTFMSHLGPYFARAVSFLLATTFTWALNRTITFKRSTSGKGVLTEFIHYLMLVLFGGGVNYGTYAFCIFYFSLFAKNPILGVALGSACGALVNFLSLKFVLFKKAR